MTSKKVFPVILLILITFGACDNEEASSLADLGFADPTSFEQLEANMIASFSEARTNSSKYIEEDNGQIFVNLNNFNVGLPSITIDQRMEVITQEESNALRVVEVDPIEILAEQGFSLAYQNIIRELTVLTNDLENVSFEDNMVRYNELLDKVVDSDELNEYEKIGLDQVVNFSISILTQTYAVRDVNQENARLLGDDCDVDWISVGRTAIIGGITLGATLGWQGIKAGAIATSAAGNPIVGGIVGGIAGFSAGFVIGGVIGGVADYVAQTALPREQSGVQVCDGGEGTIASSLGVCLDQFCTQRDNSIASSIGNISFLTRTYNGYIIFQ